MTSFLAIAWNAARELTRQPLLLLVITVPPLFMLLLANTPYLALDSEAKLIKDSALAVTFLVGLLTAVFCASQTLAREIRSGTALAVLAKPVGRARFLAAKYCGVAAVLVLVVQVNLMGALVAGRVIPTFAGEGDGRAMATLVGGLVLGLAVAGYTNFFQHRQFVGDAVLAVTVGMTAGFVVLNFFNRAGEWQSFGKGMDWRLVPAGVLLLFALWVLAGLAVACSTRLELIPTLAVCSVLFLVGLMADYLFGRPASNGSLLAQLAYSVVPNWQLFWMADAIEGEKRIPWSYVGQALGYVAGYVTAALALALALFEDRELA